MMEFHISRQARDRYGFAESLFSFTGNVILGSISACREFAHRMNRVRDAALHPERAVPAAALYAMGLIDEASHALLAGYRRRYDPQVMTAALDYFGAQVGEHELDRLLLIFVERFPGLSVYRGEQTPLQWLHGATDGVAHRELAIEELVLLWLANRNLAFRPFEELFHDAELAEQTAYRQVAAQLPAYFATRPLVPLPSGPVTLFDLLRTPAVAAPSSLREQLMVIRTRWSPLLDGALERFLLLAGDILLEEERAIWARFHPPNEEDEARARAEAARAAEEAARRRRAHGLAQGGGVTSHSDVPVFGDPAHEYERFSTDVAWMPTAVLIAKSTYVWLAQLSRKYQSDIRRLDQIPDDELDELARRGMNSLWLIGIWERSRASRTIKQLCGNRDAVASAYSLYDYRIADDLGGESAYIVLRDRCYHRGIRLASDMVPNHMGIDSPWVAEHPDWFLSRSDRPYPAYDFSGPDLSSDPRVEIRIERHYYEQTDAAVVFERRDRASGEVRYIYHGNDGTCFPWNDTAQLDYLNPAVREQVIQTILHVARLFPVIRFDAAMTLARRHYQRLWFPHPGTGGAIPSRAEFGMTREEFSRHMPAEFWREVVDRVAAEVPGTLLLAEAFWLMEGYFVRTLGMHRVYNSAFMNMMRDEENEKYRQVIKNTLEFDPEIMKRYVNFMSNPDERTAIDQYGTGDKYFGIATVMSTLPGLPMFGHGQVEGYTEKYGMEYRWPRYQEDPNPQLVTRHMREIAPLLYQRDLFAESENFLLYDFYRADGAVDENVFAYSNRSRDGRRALIVYHNRYAETRGTLDRSAAFMDKGAGGLRQRRLREGLNLSSDPAVLLAFCDSLTGLHYLRRSHELAESGFTVALHAYQCHVFLDWQELRATAAQPWDRLCDELGGRGVTDLDDALLRLQLRPVHDALRRLLEPELVRELAQLAGQHAPKPDEHNARIARQASLLQTIWRHECAWMHEIDTYTGSPAAARFREPGVADRLPEDFRQFLCAVLRLPELERQSLQPWSAAARRVLPSHSPQLMATKLWGPVLAWAALQSLATLVRPDDAASAALEFFDQLRLREPLAQAFAALGLEGEDGWRAAARVRVALRMAAGKFVEEKSASTALWPIAAWDDADLRWLVGWHEAEGHRYFVEEPYEEMLWWLRLPELCRIAATTPPSSTALDRLDQQVVTAAEAAARAGYRLDAMYAAEVDALESTVDVESQGESATDAPTSELAADEHAGKTHD